MSFINQLTNTKNIHIRVVIVNTLNIYSEARMYYSLQYDALRFIDSTYNEYTLPLSAIKNAVIVNDDSLQYDDHTYNGSCTIITRVGEFPIWSIHKDFCETLCQWLKIECKF